MTQTKKQSGFTIIEVVLVLAIAGLIFLIVFLALPQLQRSRRDTQRRQDAGKIVGALESYAANANGQYPDNATQQAAFIAEYLDGKFNNPTDGGNYNWSFGNTVPAATDEVVIRVQGTCDGATFAGGTARQVAVAMKLEEGTYCQDNQ